VGAGADNIDSGLDEPRRFIVCGDNPLALRLAKELITRYSAEVAVILADRRIARGPEIARLPGIELVEAARPSVEAFRRADLASAVALALVAQDDAGNIDAALLAHEVNPRVRVVIRMFNTSLGEGVRELLDDCAVLSESAIAAPGFVAAALGVTGTSLIRLAGRDFVVTRRSAAPQADVVCGLAVDGGGSQPEVLPADEERADLVLAVNEAPPPVPARRRRRHPLRTMALLVERRLRVVLGVLAGLLLIGSCVLKVVKHVGWWHAAYLTVLTTFGGANPDPTALAAEQVTQVLLTIVSVALIPVLTAAVVDAMVNARLRLAAGGLTEPIEGHLVVVGLGNVGTRVMQALHEAGVDVVGVDRSERARGVPVARELQIPLIIGDATREETLRSASVQTCRALVVVSVDDVNNLETALLGRAIQPGVWVVLRLFDGDFADRVQQAFQIILSRSVSYLAAPTFAAAMLGQQIIDVIPIGRRVLVVAEVPIGDRCELEGEPVEALYRPHQVRLLGIRTGRGEQTLWSPPRQRQLLRTDRVLVVATRAGLSWVLDATAEPTVRRAT
jgi:Trk K+ transport system NAD-binding subunit